MASSRTEKLLQWCRGQHTAINAPKRIASLFAVYATISVLLVALLMPPFQAADELNHAERAEQIATGMAIAMRSADGSIAGGMVHAGLQRLAAPFDSVRFHPRVRVDPFMRAASTAVGWGPLQWAPFSNTAIYPPFLYLPTSLTLSIGHAAHLSVRQTMILSRLLTGLACGAIATLAIVLADGAAPLLFALLCLPMNLALFAAISQDGPMIACAALAAVLIARPVGLRRGFPLACVLLALVVTARPAYLPLAAVLFFAPGISSLKRLAGTSIVLLTAGGWVLLTGRKVMPLQASLHIAQQLAVIRHHPALVSQLMQATLTKQIADGLPVGREFIGVLGWLDTTLPNPYYALAGCMLLTAVAVSHSPLPGRVPVRAFLSMPIILGTIGMVYGLQYLSWSRIGGSSIDGVQGRYFLPLAPFLLFALPARPFIPQPLLLSGILAFPLLSIALTTRAILVRYYFG